MGCSSFGLEPDSWDLLQSSGIREGREVRQMMGEREMTFVCKEACFLPQYQRGHLKVWTGSIWYLPVLGRGSWEATPIPSLTNRRAEVEYCRNTAKHGVQAQMMRVDLRNPAKRRPGYPRSLHQHPCDGPGWSAHALFLHPWFLQTSPLPSHLL